MFQWLRLYNKHANTCDLNDHGIYFAGVSAPQAGEWLMSTSPGTVWSLGARITWRDSLPCLEVNAGCQLGTQLLFTWTSLSDWFVFLIAWWLASTSRVSEIQVEAILHYDLSWKCMHVYFYCIWLLRIVISPTQVESWEIDLHLSVENSKAPGQHEDLK